MSNASQAISDIEQALTQVQLPGYLKDPQKVGKCYEVFILDLVMEVADQFAINCRLVDRGGNQTRDAVVRQSPGVLHSEDESYTHAEIRIAGQEPLEAHVSVQFSGRSGLAHEADVVLVRADHVDVFRTLECPPPGPLIVWAAECKRLGKGPSLGLAREALGLLTELRPSRHTCVANKHGETWSELLTTYGCRWDSKVEPGSQESIDRFQASLKQVFHEYQMTGR